MAERGEMMDVDHPKGKENVRKLTRGEKSKIAAKGRRDKEHDAMLQLINELPVEDEILNKMDKAAVVKLATCYLKIKHFVQKDISTFGQKAITNGSIQSTDKTTAALQAQAQSKCGAMREKEGQFMLEALNGFLIFVNRKGSIKFVTNTIQDHLGLKQEYLFGKNIYDYIHESDHKELTKQFTEDKRADNPNISPFEEEPQRVFYLRMKFNLQKPGSKAKQTGFMLVQWSGKMKRHLSMKLGTVVTDGLLCICRPMQTTPLFEIRMDGNMFMSRHDLGMTFTFCDTRIITLLGYEPNEVIGKTAYHFHNPIDAPKVGDCHHNLIIKGTSVSKYYRFMGKADNWVWLQTRATIIYNTANKPQYIVCMNYVISEEEGEKYLMLEEHQNANRQTDNTVLMLPDNQHHHEDIITLQCPRQGGANTGPTIVELDEANLEKTACFNGELDRPPTTESCMPSSTCQQTSNSSFTSAPQWNQMVTMTGFQQDNSGTPSQDPVIPNISNIPLVEVADGQCDMTVDSQISQPVMADVSDVNMAQSSSPMEDNSNNAITDPQVPECVQVCSPESSTGAYPSPLGLQRSGEHYVNGMGDQNMGASCSSSHSDDAGYESASSPYNGSYFSPQMVSPVCSYDSGSDRGGYTPDVNNRNGFIQGQNCSLGVGYGQAANQSSDMMQGEQHAMDVLSDSNTEYANPVLDEILQSLNQTTSDNLDVNMALVYSSIESLTSKAPSSMATSAMSPGANTFQQVKPIAKTRNSTVPIQQKQPLERRTDKPLLRSFLTMPKEAIPNQPPGGFIQIHNKKEDKSSTFAKDVNACVAKQGCTSAQLQNNPNLTCRNIISRGSVVGSLPEHTNGQIENNDNEALDFDEIPEYALQYLVNDFTDAQAQALIADLQGEGGLQNDSFMDTSESDFTKEFVSSLENQSMMANSSSSSDGYNSFAGPQVCSNIPFSQCKTQCNSFGISTKCNATQQHNLNSHLSDGNTATGNYSRVNSGHDHLYHQSASRLNGQNRQRFHKLPENRGVSSKLSSGQTTCHSQTQTSEHCMSELERHLRNKKLTSREMSFNGVQNAYIMNSEKPFLQQLLTGELTNDMYMRMERSRCFNKDGIKK